MTISQIRKEASKLLNSINETDILLAHCLDVSKVFLLTNPDKELSEIEIKTFQNLLSRRINREPIQYILGYVNFMNIKLKVNPNVLIPRQDTEILVAVAEKLITKDKKDKLNILDLCTGSGCIAISIMHDLSDCKKMNMYAADISEEALSLAKLNAKNNNADIEFIKSDYFDSIKEIKFDYIISNPPYIETETILTLDKQVKEYEPILALDGGKDGFDAYNKIINQARNYLNGYLLLEAGINQADKICEKMKENGYINIFIEKDYNGIDRTVCGFFSL